MNMFINVHYRSLNVLRASKTVEKPPKFPETRTLRAHYRVNKGSRNKNEIDLESPISGLSKSGLQSLMCFSINEPASVEDSVFAKTRRVYVLVTK
jgi:hypothetical protein